MASLTFTTFDYFFKFICKNIYKELLVSMRKAYHILFSISSYTIAKNEITNNCFYDFCLFY